MDFEFLSTIEDFIFAEKVPKKADIIFVPGNGYPQMAEQAAVLYHQGLAPWILPSGRYSITLGRFSGVLGKKEKYQGTYETEWEFLQNVLVSNGVPAQRILREDKAEYTYDNALKSRKVTDQVGLEIRRAILCCKNYHARRALMYYQLVYPDTVFYVVPVCVDGITKENWRESEAGVDAVSGEVTRIMRQFTLMI